ncbi:hypothetical protein ABT160_01005 [Streptomyces sp. NPDC001941]|uniref:HAAS signaling domain-containing protein n=1 Tax=Streptomyces sp. NPDC001941 TaxID=3154659 RepID=UPI0033348704
MNTVEHPLVTAYLAAVQAETAPLPPERRAELLADLREHIALSGPGDDAHVRVVLEQLGDPRTVAASALAEEPSAAPAAPAPVPPAQGAGRTVATLLLLAFGPPLGVGSPLLGGLAVIAGLVLLWTSPLWTTGRKALATVTSAVVPLLVALGFLMVATSRGLDAVTLLVVLALVLCVPVGGAVVLLVSARRAHAR